MCISEYRKLTEDCLHRILLKQPLPSVYMPSTHDEQTDPDVQEIQLAGQSTCNTIEVL